ncbi:MAG: hypothetical protein HRF43_06640 [Phycisphaerae bacterium]|jgi:hypothetical protein
MYEQVRSRIASLLSRPRAMKPQTERQLAHHLAEHALDLAPFLLRAAELLEEYELEILFGPLFTPTLEDRAEAAEVLAHARLSAEQCGRLVRDLCADVRRVIVRLPDGSGAPLAIHEVMVERFVRLLRLDHEVSATAVATLDEVLPAKLFPIGAALLREPGMTARHQEWLATLVRHAVGRREVTRAMLETAAGFIAAQPNLEPPALTAAAEALLRATRQTHHYASGGHAYWSPDVAQHHQYRGQGRIDRDRLVRQQAELERVTALVEDLRLLEAGAVGES